jgi:hypothetical protein
VILAILLVVVAPILGFAVGRMKDINTGAQPPVKAGFLGAGWALVVLGAAASVIWAVVWYWSFATGTQSTWIDLKAVFYYSLLVLLGGSITMTITHLRH